MEPNRFRRELLKASLLNLLCLAWLFRAPLLERQVLALQARPPSADAFVGMSEMVYQLQPALFTQARQLRAGLFPAWSPGSQGGTPLIAKMQNGVFAPHHLPLYVVPERWMPYALSAVVALKYYLTFVFAYLLARCLGLGFAAGFLAGLLYQCGPGIQGLIFSWPGTGMYLPLQLLAVELGLRRRRRLFRLLWPPLVALPFFSGHFESAFWIAVASAAYFAARLWREAGVAPAERWPRAAEFAGLSLLGAAGAAAQISPALEYVRWSYNGVWHDARWFAFWEHETIAKHLTGEDAPLLVAGFGALAGFLALLRGCWRAESELSGRELGRKAAAALLLAFSIGCLAELGFDSSLWMVGVGDFARWDHRLMSLALLLLAVWGWARAESPGLRALGWLLFGGFLIMQRTPGLANLLLHLPVVGHFHNAGYRWDLALARSVLAAAALESALVLRRRSAAEARAAALKAAGLAAVIVAGFAAAPAVRGAVARRAVTSIAPTSKGGGLMGAERISTYRRRHVVAGWAPIVGRPTITAVSLGLALGSQIKLSVDATPTLSLSANRAYFHGELPLEEEGVFSAFARVRRADGADEFLMGPQLEVRRLNRRRAWWLVAAGLLLLPSVLLGAPAVFALYAALLVGSTHWARFDALPPGEIPFRSAGIERLGQDHEPFRVASLQYEFMQADYPNVYGLSDIRTGGDNLDLLPAIYFSHLAGSLLGGGPAEAETGLKLWGLLNVKYLLQRAGSAPPHPALVPEYSGPELAIFRNAHFRPRAQFFDAYVHVPLGDWRDWGARGRFLGPLAGALARKQLDPLRTLLLHDPPAPPGQPSGAPAAESSARIVADLPQRVEVAVAAKTPGFLFLGDSLFPGWKAFVDGREAPLLRAWLNFRAVQDPRGVSRTLFFYRSARLRLAVLVSVILFLSWFWAYFRYLAYAAPAAAPETAPGGRKKKPLPTPAPAEDEGLIAACASAAEAIVVSLCGCAGAYWTLWTACVYHGGIQRTLPAFGDGALCNLAATAVVAAALFLLWTGWRRRRAPAAPVSA